MKLCEIHHYDNDCTICLKDKIEELKADRDAYMLLADAYRDDIYIVDELLDTVVDLRTKLNDTIDFAIWMTGCGYEFTQHKYFCKQRDKLLIGK